MGSCRTGWESQKDRGYPEETPFTHMSGLNLLHLQSPEWNNARGFYARLVGFHGRQVCAVGFPECKEERGIGMRSSVVMACSRHNDKTGKCGEGKRHSYEVWQQEEPCSLLS